MANEQFPLPSAANIAKVLSTLLGCEIQAKECEPWHPTEDKPYTVAVYRTDLGAIGIFCLCEIAAACCLGGTLTQLDQNLINEAITNSKPSDEMVENFKEVMNTITTILNNNTSPHVINKELLMVPPPVADDIKKLLEKPFQRRDLLVTVPSYPECHLSIITLEYKQEDPTEADNEWINLLTDKLSE